MYISKIYFYLVLSITLLFSNDYFKWVPIIGEDEIVMVPVLDKNDLIGTWEESCIDLGSFGSAQEIWVFNNDQSFIYNYSEYSSRDCTGEKITNETDSGTYKLGSITTGADGSPAQEIDFIVKNFGAYFAMIRYTSTRMIMSDGPFNTKSGDTAEERLDNFKESNIFFKKKQ